MARIPALLLLSVLTWGCSGEQNTDPDLSGLKVYRHAIRGTPTSLDPVQAATAYSNLIVLNVYDTLYAYRYLARPYEIRPNLAADMPQVSEDGLTYTIRIKPGVRFIDDAVFPQGRGREVIAEDFVYSLKRQFDPANRPQGAWLWQGRIQGLNEWKEAGSDYDVPVDGLEAIDRHTIRIRLTRPYPQLINTLAMGQSAVVPREAVEAYGTELALNPVGSGPFRLVSFDSSRIVMVPNENYRREAVDIYAEGFDEVTQGFTGVQKIHGRAPPFLDRLEVHFIQDGAARWNSFTKGTEVQFTSLPVELVDIVLDSVHPPSLKPQYADLYHVRSGPEAGFVFQALNMDFEEFGYHPDPAQNERNKALRCAIRKAFDWEARNDSFYFNLGNVFPGIIPPSVPEFDAELSRDSVTRDVAGARALLADNGWTAESLPELIYGTPSGIRYRQFYEQMRAWLKDIGYPPEKVILKQYATFGDINKAWKESQLPYVALGWLLDYPDAENTLQLFYGPNGSPGSNNANYSNPEYDALYEKASVMLPSPERTEIYRHMNQLLIEDCVAISGLARTVIYLWHKDVYAYPDTEIVGGFFLKYVDVAAPEQSAGE